MFLTWKSLIISFQFSDIGVVIFVNVIDFGFSYLSLEGQGSTTLFFISEADQGYELDVVLTLLRLVSDSFLMKIDFLSVYWEL